jgi:hypothetical protein
MSALACLANKLSGPPSQLLLATASSRDLPPTATAMQTQAVESDVVELFGYSGDLREVEAYLEPGLAPIACGTYYSVLAPVGRTP